MNDQDHNDNDLYRDVSNHDLIGIAIHSGGATALEQELGRRLHAKIMEFEFLQQSLPEETCDE